MNEIERRTFFEIHQDLPREGPGSPDSTRRAFDMLDLPPRPRILEVGCGPDARALDLIGKADATLFALDMHEPFLRSLSEKVRESGLRDHAHPILADMSRPPFPAESFDLIWAEGCLYSIGFENALSTLRPIVREGGVIAATEISWIGEERPDELLQFWAGAYPALTDVAGNLALAEGAGFASVGHFILPEAAWWDDYYTPMEKRLDALRVKHKTTKPRWA